ncbi:MAG: DivIVA domain-containing protein, partial [Cyanobacteria bacterium J06648_11]
MNLRAAIDRLEELVISSSPIPLTGIKLIRERDLLGDLDKIRLNIPNAIAEAERIIADGDRVVSQAEAHAQNIINTAQARAEQLVSESTIRRRAEQEAA